MAAERGNRRAQYNIARDYEKGTGVIQDREKALYWYRKAAENGSPLAMEQLAEAYQFGRLGLPHDPDKADYWYRKANETRKQTGEVDPRSLPLIEKIKLIWF